MRWLWLILWIITLFVGTGLATVVPEQFMYITGFTAGTFAFMFLRLFKEFKR